MYLKKEGSYYELLGFTNAHSQTAASDNPQNILAEYA